MRTLIRIEYEDGYGIFFSKLYSTWDCSDEGTQREFYAEKDFNSVCERHRDFNSPDQDGLNTKKDEKAWFCAYKSVEQLQQWITTYELKHIISLGFKVLMLDVSEYQEGKDQIMYTKESIVSLKDISSLFV